MLKQAVWGNLWGKNKKHPKVLELLDFMAERTGLEPATPGVTGRYSNQLNYRSAAVNFFTTHYNQTPCLSKQQRLKTGVPKGIRTPVLTVKG